MATWYLKFSMKPQQGGEYRDALRSLFANTEADALREARKKFEEVKREYTHYHLSSPALVSERPLS